MTTKWFRNKNYEHTFKSFLTWMLIFVFCRNIKETLLVWGTYENLSLDNLTATISKISDSARKCVLQCFTSLKPKAISSSMCCNQTRRASNEGEVKGKIFSEYRLRHHYILFLQLQPRFTKLLMLSKQVIQNTFMVLLSFIEQVISHSMPIQSLVSSTIQVREPTRMEFTMS